MREVDGHIGLKFTDLQLNNGGYEDAESGFLFMTARPGVKIDGFLASSIQRFCVVIMNILAGKNVCHHHENDSRQALSPT